MFSSGRSKQTKIILSKTELVHAPRANECGSFEERGLGASWLNFIIRPGRAGQGLYSESAIFFTWQEGIIMYSDNFPSTKEGAPLTREKIFYGP